MLGKDGTVAVRRFWMDITDNVDYPNTPEFNLKKDKVNLVDNLKKGDMIKVAFQLDGRKYDKTAEGGKKGVITNLVVWKIEVVRTQSAATIGNTAGPVVGGPSLPAVAPAVAPPLGAFANADESEDLPFL